MAALDGIRVIDLTRVLAGPWATQNLADFGADVVKVERPEVGDETRHWGPPYYKKEGYEQSAYFLCANRNKRSIALDMTESDDLDTLYRLIKEADVLVENYKVGGLCKYGLDYDSVQKVNPRLIYCSITGFGQDGPYSEYAGYDFMIQGMAGLMSITGKPDNQGGEPTKVGVALTDVMTGLYVSNAILAALIARASDGVGQYIDISLFDVSVATLANQATNYLVSGQSPQRLGNAHPNIVPYQVFATKDGYVIVAVGNDQQFAQLTQVLSLPKLSEDARFKTNESRVINREALVPLLESAMRQKKSTEWLDIFQKNTIPCGPINDLEQVFNHPQLIHRGMKIDQDGVPGVANPVLFSRTPNVKSAAPPLLDEHHDEVLADWLNET